MPWRRVAQGVSLLSTGVLAGAFVFSRYGLRPAVATLPVEAHLAVRQALVRRLRVVMPPLMVTAGGSVGLVALLQRGTRAFLPSCVSLVCAAVPLAVSSRGNGPLMLQVLRWSPDTP